MKKILFNNTHYLTDSVIMGIKTQTRRLIPFKTLTKYGVNKHTFDSRKSDLLRDAAYKIGDKIAVAQPYRECVAYIKSLEEFRSYSWAEIEAHLKQLSGWNNPMFVKAEWMPYQIEITNVRAERLQDITNQDCMDEGIRLHEVKGCPPFYFGGHYHSYDTPKEAFAVLIDAISGKGTWEKNAYAYVYEFKVVKNGIGS